MEFTIKFPNLSGLKENAKTVAQEVMDRPVPLGKTVLITAVSIGVLQVLIFRRYNVSIIVSKA